MNSFMTMVIPKNRMFGSYFESKISNSLFGIKKTNVAPKNIFLYRNYSSREERRNKKQTQVQDRVNNEKYENVELSSNSKNVRQKIQVKN